VEITWEPPNYDPLQITLSGYNVRRNGTKLNSGLITDLSYTDQNVPDGQYIYCVTALYNLGASEGVCKNVEIVTGIISRPTTSDCLQIYPNPSSGVITIETPFQGHVSILNIRGQELLEQTIYEPNSTIDVGVLPGGLYLVRLVGGNEVRVGKFVKE